LRPLLLTALAWKPTGAHGRDAGGLREGRAGVKRYQRVMNTRPCYKETTYHHFHEVSAQPSRRGWFSAARPGDQYAE
jgi:hypothetical protein